MAVKENVILMVNKPIILFFDKFKLKDLFIPSH